MGRLYHFRNQKSSGKEAALSLEDVARRDGRALLRLVVEVRIGADRIAEFARQPYWNQRLSFPSVCSGDTSRAPFAVHGLKGLHGALL